MSWFSARPTQGRSSPLAGTPESGDAPTTNEIQRTDGLSDGTREKPGSDPAVNPLSPDIFRIFGLLILGVYSLFIGYCLTIQLSQESRIRELQKEVKELKKLVNETVINVPPDTSSDDGPCTSWEEMAEIINYKVFNTLSFINGSLCSAIARNCAVDLVRYVPTSFLYSGLTKCGELVGLA